MGKVTIPLVAEYLSAGNTTVRSSAALALGDSRHPAALEYLMQILKQEIPDDFREDVLLAIALLRLPAATEFLFGLLGSKSKDTMAVVAALAVLRHDAKVRERVQSAIAPLNNADLQRLFEKKFHSL